MSGLATIVALTLQEALRRRVLLAVVICGAAFLALHAIGLHFIGAELSRGSAPDELERRMVLNFFTIAGLFAVNFLTVMSAVLLPVDTLSGEIGSGVIQTLASKPIRRSDIVLGKWLGFGIVLTGYLLLLAGGVLLNARLIGGVTLPHVERGLPFMWLGAVVMLTLSIWGGTRFSTITNGITIFGLYGLAFIGGWVERIASFTNNDAARQVGTATSLLIPVDAMWSLAAYHMQPPLMRDLQMTPFSPASVPTPAMVWWTLGYAALLLFSALRHFNRRNL